MAECTADGPRRSGALLFLLVTLFFYALFLYFDLGNQWYEWSKTLAPYEIRQHLGMSKRFLLQYGHIFFLFLLLLVSKYIFTTDRIGPLYRKSVDKLMVHVFPIFILHFPLLFFLAAVTDYDRTSNWQQIALLVSVLTLCILFGRICAASKPRYDAGLKRGLVVLDARWPGAQAGRSRGATVPDAAARRQGGPLSLTVSHSYALNMVKIVATLCVVFGHFSFQEFTSWNIPGFPGHAPRFAVPAFFMLSGYFAMLSIDWAGGGTAALIFKRYWSYYYLIVPMVLAVPILDSIGYSFDAAVYRYDDYYLFEEVRRPYGLLDLIVTIPNCLLYLNEIWIYNLLGFEREFGGARCFSNDPYWFLCYLMPYAALLVVACKVAGRAKYAILAAMMLLIGPPILLLAPLFFSGTFAYLIHKRI
ncbi:MAG: acyltransferase family protein [Candidatus Krumholzibacteria bacterium]